MLSPPRATRIFTERSRFVGELMPTVWVRERRGDRLGERIRTVRLTALHHVRRDVELHCARPGDDSR